MSGWNVKLPVTVTFAVRTTVGGAADGESAVELAWDALEAARPAIVRALSDAGFSLAGTTQGAEWTRQVRFDVQNGVMEEAEPA